MDIFLSLTFKITPTKNYCDEEELISFNDIDKIINNLDIKKVPGTDRINNKLLKHLKPGLLKFLHFFSTCASILAFIWQNGKFKMLSCYTKLSNQKS